MNSEWVPGVNQAQSLENSSVTSWVINHWSNRFLPKRILDFETTKSTQLFMIRSNSWSWIDLCALWKKKTWRWVKTTQSHTCMNTGLCSKNSAPVCKVELRHVIYSLEEARFKWHLSIKLISHQRSALCLYFVMWNWSIVKSICSWAPSFSRTVHSVHMRQTQIDKQAERYEAILTLRGAAGFWIGWGLKCFNGQPIGLI